MRANEFLIEYDRSKTLQNFGAKIFAIASKDKKVSYFLMKGGQFAPNAVEMVLGQIEEADPTPHKEYTQWLCKVYATGTAKMEDLRSRGNDSLKRFNQLKLKKMLKPEHRDINRFKSFQEFESVVSSYPEMEEQGIDKGQAKEIYKDADLRIIVPEDERAACYYGNGTKWCTAAKSNNMFDQYNKQGPMYIVIPTKVNHQGEKYQFHFKSGQFMDDSDSPLDMGAMVNAYPQLKQVFAQQAKDFFVVQLMPNPDKVIAVFEQMKNRYVDFTARAFDQDNQIMLRNMAMGFVGSGINKVFAKDSAYAIGEDLRDDAVGLAQLILGSLTAEMLSNEDLLADEIHDSVSTWISDSAINFESMVNDGKDDGQVNDDNEMELEYEIISRFNNRFTARVLPRLKADVVAAL